MAFTNAQILRFTQEAELEVSGLDLIVDRIALAITANAADYNLPSYVTSIRSITYQGKPLDPYSGQEMIRSGSTPTSTTTGTPLHYVFSYRGRGVIRFYPTPSVGVSAPATNLWEHAAIASGVIIEFYRVPKLTGSINRLPSDLRDSYLEDYTYYRAYAIEGKEQDLAASQFHSRLWKQSLNEVKSVVNQIKKCVSYEVKPIISNDIPVVRRPRLPSNFGRVVS
jgi:hypothetical protein